MRDAQRDALMNVLKSPMSYQDAADALGSSYHTVRRNIQELVDEGLVVELPFRQEGLLMFTLSGTDVEQQLMFPVDGALTPLAVVAEHFAALGSKSNFFLNVGRMLSQVMFRSYMLERNLGKDSMDPERQLEGNKFPAEMRSGLRRSINHLREYLHTLEALVVRDELWTDEPGYVYQHCGELDLEATAKLAEEYRTGIKT